MNYFKKNVLKLVLVPLLSLVLMSPTSHAGNDSVAFIYIDYLNVQKIYRIETKVTKGDYGITIELSNKAEFEMLSRNRSFFYIRSDEYNGFARNLQRVGEIIHGKTSEGFQVAIIYAPNDAAE